MKRLLFGDLAGDNAGEYPWLFEPIVVPARFDTLIWPFLEPRLELL
jgi:hypothetical protein